MEASGPTTRADDRTPATDFFQLLGEPRRPWLDAGALKQKFLALSTETHPDRFHAMPEAEREMANRRYTELNAAWQCLREPKERLGHLLALELGARPADIQRVPAGLTEQFFDVGRLCREATALLEAKAKISSPVLQAQLFGRAAEMADRLLAMQQKINRERDGLLGELQGMNPAWESEDAARRSSLLPRLEEIYRLLGYFGRWSEQLQERAMQLTL